MMSMIHICLSELLYLEGAVYDDMLHLDPKRARAVKHLACAVWLLPPDLCRQVGCLLSASVIMGVVCHKMGVVCG